MPLATEELDAELGAEGGSKMSVVDDPAARLTPKYDKVFCGKTTRLHRRQFDGGISTVDLIGMARPFWFLPIDEAAPRVASAVLERFCRLPPSITVLTYHDFIT